MSEIQYQNRILLRKMIQIDLKQKKPTSAATVAEKMGPESLNKAVRHREIVRVAEENFSFLDRLQKTTSHYSAVGWERNHVRKQEKVRRISQNANRFCKNPYFLHSVTTIEMNPYNLSERNLNASRAMSKGRSVSAHGSSKPNISRKRANSAMPSGKRNHRKITTQTGNTLQTHQPADEHA